MIGTNSATPSRPTASDEPVSSLDLERDRDEGGHRAGLRDRLAEHEQAEVAPAPQQAGVDRDSQYGALASSRELWRTDQAVG